MPEQKLLATVSGVAHHVYSQVVYRHPELRRRFHLKVVSGHHWGTISDANSNDDVRCLLRVPPEILEMTMAVDGCMRDHFVARMMPFVERIIKRLRTRKVIA